MVFLIHMQTSHFYNLYDSVCFSSTFPSFFPSSLLLCSLISCLPYHLMSLFCHFPHLSSSVFRSLSIPLFTLFLALPLSTRCFLMRWVCVYRDVYGYSCVKALGWSSLHVSVVFLMGLVHWALICALFIFKISIHSCCCVCVCGACLAKTERCFLHVKPEACALSYQLRAAWMHASDQTCCVKFPNF